MPSVLLIGVCVGGVVQCPACIAGFLIDSSRRGGKRVEIPPPPMKNSIITTSGRRFPRPYAAMDFRSGILTIIYGK